MTLPPFFARVADSLRPVADVDPEALAQKLEGVRVRLELATPALEAQRALMLACNLAARLYPRIVVTATSECPEAKELFVRARQLILDINPQAEVGHLEPSQRQEADTPASEAMGRVEPTTSAEDVCLQIGTSMTKETHGSLNAPQSLVTVSAHGWRVVVDPANGTENHDDSQPGHRLTWLAAAAIGMAEVFRCVFAEELGPRGRTGPQPGGFNLLTAQPVEPRTQRPPDVHDAQGDSAIDIGDLFLVGAGAIGQAAAYALDQLEVAGVLHVVDPEVVTLSNLQRYLLTNVGSVGEAKSDLVRDALSKHDSSKGSGTRNALEVRGTQGRWGDSTEHLHADQVLVALDTARDRITVAATQPRHVYNAWTQVADLGWSRHEAFGREPCLACLYYPDKARPSEHELIAAALGQPPLRVLAYLTYGLPIGYPLPGIPIIAELPAPPEAGQWTQVALIEDLVTAGVIGETERDSWADSTIGALYRDGICAGGLLPVGDLPGDVLVPLAHQSALAGIMLVAELLWSRRPEWAAQRDAAIEHRYDVLRGFPQLVARPRQRTAHCLCSDSAYIAASTTEEWAAAPRR